MLIVKFFSILKLIKYEKKVKKDPYIGTYYSTLDIHIVNFFKFCILFSLVFVS